MNAIKIQNINKVERTQWTFFVYTKNALLDSSIHNLTSFIYCILRHINESVYFFEFFTLLLKVFRKSESIKLSLFDDQLKIVKKLKLASIYSIWYFWYVFFSNNRYKSYITTNEISSPFFLIRIVILIAVILAFGLILIIMMCFRKPEKMTLVRVSAPIQTLLRIGIFHIFKNF
jgi:hypothetical protein